MSEVQIGAHSLVLWTEAGEVFLDTRHAHTSCLYTCIYVAIYQFHWCYVVNVLKFCKWHHGRPININ